MRRQRQQDALESMRERKGPRWASGFPACTQRWRDVLSTELEGHAGLRGDPTAPASKEYSGLKPIRCVYIHEFKIFRKFTGSPFEGEREPIQTQIHSREVIAANKGEENDRILPVCNPLMN